jgi:hypothetical protein
MSNSEEIAIVCNAVARAVKEAKFAYQYPFGFRRAKRHVHLASNAVDQLDSVRASLILGNVCENVYDALNAIIDRAESACLN